MAQKKPVTSEQATSRSQRSRTMMNGTLEEAETTDGVATQKWRMIDKLPIEKLYS